MVVCWVHVKLLLGNAAVCFPLKDHNQWEHQSITPCDHHYPLHVIHQHPDVDGFHPHNLQHSLCIHLEVDPHLIHAEDEMLAATRSSDEGMHETHVDRCLHCNIFWACAAICAC